MKDKTEEKMLLIQFPHPGEEHSNEDGSNIKTWNKGGHKRKFLKSKGKYVNSLDSKEGLNEIMFWGEWEAESQYEEIIYSDGYKKHYPKYIHTLIINKSNKIGLQNTDPYVFGDNFYYSCCKQQTFKQLKKLLPGSIIVFGSKLEEKFVIDTVFVVKDSESFNKDNYKKLKVSDTFMEATIKRLYDINKKCNGTIDENNVAQDMIDECNNCIEKSNNENPSWVLYKGVSHKEKENFNGMFSFFPCKIFKEGTGFERPNLSRVLNSDILNDKKSTGVSYILEFNNMIEAYNIWKRIADGVLQQGFYLGTYAKEPEINNK